MSGANSSVLKLMFPSPGFTQDQWTAEQERIVVEKSTEEKAAAEKAIAEKMKSMEKEHNKKMEEMVNRLTSEGDTMKHVEGPEGEEQAGTGGDEKVIPPRKDRSNEGTKEKGTKPMDKGESGA